MHRKTITDYKLKTVVIDAGMAEKIPVPWETYH